MRLSRASRSLASRALLALTVLACTTSIAFAGNVLRVGPGQPFAEIEDAITSANTGDLILVTPGTYAPFVLDGKGLSIVGEGGPFDLTQTPGVPEILVRNVPLGQDVTILGAHIAYRDENAPAVSISNNAGSVRLSQLDVTPTDHMFNGTTAQAIVEVTRTALFWLIDSSVAFGGLDPQGQPLNWIAHTLNPRIGNDGVSAVQLLDSHGVVQNSRLRGFSTLRPSVSGGDGLRLVDEGPDLSDASAWLLEDRLGPDYRTGFQGGSGLNGGHAVHQIRTPIERNLIRACGGPDDAITLSYNPGSGERAFGGQFGGLYGENNWNGAVVVRGNVAFRPPDHCHEVWRNESSLPSPLVPIGTALDVRVRSRTDRSYLLVFTDSSRFQLTPTPYTGRGLLDGSGILAWRSGTSPAKTTVHVSVPTRALPSLIGLQVTVQALFGPIGRELNNVGQPALAVMVP